VSKLHVIFTAEAQAEFFEAIAWYESSVPDLGKEFSREVIQALERAQQQPEMFRKIRRRARLIRLKRFKSYSVYFTIKDDILSVLAVFRGARNPEELRRRLNRSDDAA